MLSPYRPSLIQPLTYDRDGLDLMVVRSGVTFPGKDVLENVIEDYSQQVSELQKQLSEVSLRWRTIYFPFLLRFVDIIWLKEAS